HEQPGLRLYPADHLRKPGTKARVEIADGDRGVDEAADILERYLVDGIADKPVAQRRAHDKRLGEIPPARLVQMRLDTLARKRRHAKGQRPPIGVEAPRKPCDALGQVSVVAGIERIDRVQPL